MRFLAIVALIAFPLTSLAGDVVAARNLPAGTVVTAADMRPAETGGEIGDISHLVGLETRIAVYEGRPLLPNLLQEPVLVERNQLVRLNFQRGEVHIATDGRALDAGQAGDVIRVLNQASRNTISARIEPDGSLYVSR